MKKILIADDDKEMVDYLKGTLRREGFSIITAYDGEEAKQKILEDKPDILLLDIIMPKIDGWQLLQWLREEERTNIPVIIISAKGELESIQKSYSLDADHYLIKPFTIKEVKQGIDTICSIKEEQETDSQE